MPRDLKELIAHPVQVRRRMSELGFSNRSLADRIGCSDAVVGKLLCGMTTRTSTRNADAFEKELLVEPGKYFAVPPSITDSRSTADRGSDVAEVSATEPNAA